MHFDEPESSQARKARDIDSTNTTAPIDIAEPTIAATSSPMRTLLERIVTADCALIIL